MVPAFTERKKYGHSTGHFDFGVYPCIGRSGCPQPEKERQALQLRLFRLHHGREMESSRWAYGTIAAQTALAWTLATLVFQLGRLLGLG